MIKMRERLMETNIVIVDMMGRGEALPRPGQPGGLPLRV
jgi:hypothetical protein